MSQMGLIDDGLLARLRLGFALVLFGVAAATQGAAAAEPQRIVESFQRDAYDKTLWTIERIGAKVDSVGGQLKIEIPKGSAGRPPVGLRGLFRIEGDFNIRGGYVIATWPTPKKEWINVAICIEGADGPAAVIRTNHAKEGSGYSLWHEPADKNKSGAWKQIATKDAKGMLRLKRTGERLQFLVGGPVESAARELGGIDYGTSPITGVTFRVTVPETQAPVEVAFGKIEIEAERLIGPPVPARSMFGRRAWLGGTAVLAAVAAFTTWILLRAGRSKRGAPLSGKGGA